MLPVLFVVSSLVYPTGHMLRPIFHLANQVEPAIDYKVKTQNHLILETSKVMVTVKITH